MIVVYADNLFYNISLIIIIIINIVEVLLLVNSYDHAGVALVQPLAAPACSFSVPCLLNFLNN